MKTSVVLHRDENEKVWRLLGELASGVHEWERGHGERVQVYAVATGAELGMDDRELRDLAVAGALHDIGKLEWPEGPWSEPERVLLTGESERVRAHASWGSVRLEQEGFGERVCQWVREHHEREDGTGYPGGLEEVSLGGRILGLAEFFDGVAYGPWSKKGADEARNWVLAAGPGGFGEDVYEAFLRVERLIQPVESE